MSEQIRCVINRITFQSDDDGYAILSCRAEGYKGLTTAIGYLPQPNVGAKFLFTGEWVVDRKYGRQFRFDTYQEELPATLAGIEKYLGSGLIKGIGKVFAKRIVKLFGLNTIEVIDKYPERLLEVPGLGRKKAEKVRDSWKEHNGIKDVIMFLQKYGASPAIAAKIYGRYKDESISKIQENPYCLVEEISGIGFVTADTIALNMGYEKEKYVRLKSGLIYTMQYLVSSGHCYATRDMLVKRATKLLDVSDGVLDMTLDEMIRNEDVLVEELTNEEDSRKNKAIYIPSVYYSENGVADKLCEIYEAESNVHISNIKIQSRNIEYDELQREAIEKAATSKVFIMTGGPGTGKTTTTLGIIDVFRRAGADILLAAPTGRAAKRMTEATGMEALTIHRMLEASIGGGYGRNEENPLEGDVLILDECSMIDIFLMNNLLRAVPKHMVLILIGDIDQLPSVGAGNVLMDIINSNCFPVVRLNKIFRQAAESNIIANAHRINEGQFPIIDNDAKSDFFFQDVCRLNGADYDVEDTTLHFVTKMVSEKLPAYYHVKPTDIQVLTPMQKGSVGAIKLNEMLQNAINHTGGDTLTRHGITFRVNDKIMQIVNDYDKDVYNGDLGYVIKIDADNGILTANFEGRKIEYTKEELEELTLAYATTIHKSQGSEYPIVVMPIIMEHKILLQKNLLYTGITRAKKALLLVGMKQAIAYAIHNSEVSKRNTMLKERIIEDINQAGGAN